MPAPTLPAPGSRPLVIEVTRGPAVESRHQVHCVVVDETGAAVAVWGDEERATFPRSACKPIQQIPLVENGAADTFNLSTAELALACASHSGEPRHGALVAAWLERLGLSVADLECGSHWPYHEPSAQALLARGERPSALLNNCSGKHAGFLTLARHQNWPIKGYIEAEHPVQRAVTAALSDLMGLDLAAQPMGCDGCGIPTIAAPLRGLALAMARMAAPDGLGPARARACRRLLTAMTEHPDLVAGSGRFDTDLMRVTGKRIATKVGAEGVHVAAIPERGWGIALKAEDGATRAADLAMVTVLDGLGLLSELERSRLDALLAPTLRNRAGRVVGEIRSGPPAF